MLWRTPGRSLFSRFPFAEIILSANADDFRVRAFPHLYRNWHNHTVRCTPAVDRAHLRRQTALPRPHTGRLTQAAASKAKYADPLRPHIKLIEAFGVRACRPPGLTDMIAETGGKCIVWGGFNDVPGCYALRSLASTRTARRMACRRSDPPSPTPTGSAASTHTLRPAFHHTAAHDRLAAAIPTTTRRK